MQFENDEKAGQCKNSQKSGTEKNQRDRICKLFVQSLLVQKKDEKIAETICVMLSLNFFLSKIDLHKNSYLKCIL